MSASTPYTNFLRSIVIDILFATKVAVRTSLLSDLLGGSSTDPEHRSGCFRKHYERQD